MVPYPCFTVINEENVSEIHIIEEITKITKKMFRRFNIIEETAKLSKKMFHSHCGFTHFVDSVQWSYKSGLAGTP